MSLVTALVGREGVVMFADTQETVGGYAKKAVEKLTVWKSKDNRFRIAISGATDNTTYLEMVEREIVEVLVSAGYSFPVLEKLLSDALAVVYANHIWPQSTKAPLIEHLVSIQPLPNGEPKVIHISGTAARFLPITVHDKSVGIGAYLADYLFAQLLGGGQSQEELAIASTCVGKEVHDNVDGCGPVDRIVLLGANGEYGELNAEMIRELENNCYALGEVTRNTFVAAANVMDHIDDELEYISAELRHIHDANAEFWNNNQTKIRDNAEWQERIDEKRRSSGT